MSAASAARVQLVDTLQGRIAILRRDLATVRAENPARGFVVMCEDVPLCFDVAGGRAANPTPAGTPGAATHFSYADAVTVAATVTNGNGIEGIAVHVSVATAAALQSTREVLVLALTNGHPRD